MSSSSLVTYVAPRRCSLFQLDLRPLLSRNTMCDVASNGCCLSASMPPFNAAPCGSVLCCHVLHRCAYAALLLAVLNIWVAVVASYGPAVRCAHFQRWFLYQGSEYAFSSCRRATASYDACSTWVHSPFSSCCTLLVKINISSIDHGYRLRNKKKSSRTMIFSLQKMRFQ